MVVEYVKNNLFLKSFGPMASFHKVIKLLKFKSQRICIVSNGRCNRESATEWDFTTECLQILFIVKNYNETLILNIK